MECDICSTKSGSGVPVHCTSCARNALYAPRLAFTSAAIESDNLAQDIKDLTTSTGTDNRPIVRTESARWDLEWLRTSTIQSQRNVETIRQHISGLRQEIEATKKKHSQLEHRIENGRSTLGTVQQAVPPKRTDIVAHNERKIVKGRDTLHIIAEKSRESRAFLAREAASLYRLKHTIRVNRKGEKVDCYFIGGICIPDLRDINSK